MPLTDKVQLHRNWGGRGGCVEGNLSSIVSAHRILVYLWPSPLNSAPLLWILLSVKVGDADALCTFKLKLNKKHPIQRGYRFCNSLATAIITATVS